MTLKFHNTLTGQVDEFVAQTENKVLLYTCGPTVYSYSHIGNWVAYIYWDILVRVLMTNNYEVTRVMNITDVGHMTSDADEGEDKLEKGARREGKTAWEIADFYTDDFIKGMNRLGLIQPQIIAKATDYVNLT
jgi:cysteinyl-tRNA synthetase